MTKQEILQGALALNESDKKYTVSVEGDKIIIETKYHGTRVRESTFRCVAQLWFRYLSYFWLITKLIIFRRKYDSRH